jgi:hypothetical protein
MENGELRIAQRETKDSTGYSEVKVDRDLELHAGQWLDLKGKTKGKQQKLMATKQVVAKSATGSQITVALDNLQQELGLLITRYLGSVTNELEQADVLLKQITNLQSTQRVLLKAMLWEQKGELDVTKLPKEAQNLLK